MIKNLIIRPEEHKDYKNIVSLILRSFQEGTDYSDGTDIIALVEEIRDSKFYIPELSFVAELRLHRIIRQGSSARDFVPVQSFKNEGILYVFPVF